MDPVQTFLQDNALAPPAFAPTSRYYGIATAQVTQPDGRTAVYVQRRFLPPPENFAPLQVITVAAGDRLDNIAARYIGDPAAVMAAMRREQGDAARSARCQRRRDADHHTARGRARSRRCPITSPRGSSSR